MELLEPSEKNRLKKEKLHVKPQGVTAGEATLEKAEEEERNLSSRTHEILEILPRILANRCRLSHLSGDIEAVTQINRPREDVEARVAKIVPGKSLGEGVRQPRDIREDITQHQWRLLSIVNFDCDYLREVELLDLFYLLQEMQQCRNLPTNLAKLASFQLEVIEEMKRKTSQLITEVNRWYFEENALPKTHFARGFKECYFWLKTKLKVNGN